MNKDTLITSLVASLEAAKHKPDMLTDEDFVLDPAGEWIKHGNNWTTRTSSIYLGAMLYGGFGVLMHNPLTGRPYQKTDWDIEQEAKQKEFEAEINALPGHRIITTHEQRLVRYATKRANEIIFSPTKRPDR